MEKIKKSELFQKLYSNYNEDDSPFEIRNYNIVDDSSPKNIEPISLKNIKFVDCNFSIKDLPFKNVNDTQIHQIVFYQCRFEENIIISSDNLNNLFLYETFQTSEKSITIKGNIDFVVFDGDLYNNPNKKPLPGFKGKLNIQEFVKNISIRKIHSYNTLTIASTFKFNDIDISRSNFSNITIFSQYIQNLTLKFLKNPLCPLLMNNPYGEIDNFELEFSLFNSLRLIKTDINNVSSFQYTSVNTIELNKVKFKGRIYFDDFKVLAPKDCDRQTIRIIKQELQKTENRIDFDRYRSYELELYKKELKEKEKWWHGDLLILRLNSLFSNHGLSWKKAIGMTFLFSLLFYTMLYGVERLYNKFTITEISFDHYTSGYFKFFLITNFYDPLATEKGKFIETFAEWIPFILGKIIIGYGLFETVQSFRKYKK